MIDPRSPWMGKWDMCNAGALIFTTFVTPVELGFLPPPKRASDILFLVNRVIDGIFAIDIVLSFFMMYKREGTTRSLLDANAAWEFRLNKTAGRYLRGFFALDVGSLVPSIFDFIALSASEVCITLNDAGNTQGEKPLKMLRMIRVLRLIKMTRLLKASRLLQRMERRNKLPYAASAVRSRLAPVAPTLVAFANRRACSPRPVSVHGRYAFISFLSVITQVLIIAHWFACALGSARLRARVEHAVLTAVRSDGSC
jgi:hypothetical protein